MSTRLLFPPAVIAFVLFLLGTGVVDFGFEWDILGFPTGIGAACIVLALLSLRSEWAAVAAERRGEVVAKSRMDESEELLGDPRTWIEFLWLIGFGAACYGLGFLIGPFVSITAYFLVGGRGIRRSVLVGILASAVTWLVFIKLLGTPMPVVPIFIR